MSISCTVADIHSEMLVENHQFEPTPPLFDAPLGDPVEITPIFLAEIFGIRKLESLSYCTAFFA